MKKVLSIIVCFWVLLSCSLSVQASDGVPQEVMDATKSVVRILAEHKRESFTGSGFVIKNDGTEVLIVTNDHVVADNPQRICIWVGEDRQVDAEIVFTTSAKDLCVLRLTEPVNIAPLTLSEEEAQHGAAIYAVGYPGAGDVLSDTLAHTSDSATITDGIISAIRTFTIEEGAAPVKLLQVNAAINSGNSGGPLFNTKGEVIGINTYKVNVDSQGVFGSVAISELRKLLDEYSIVLVEEVPETEALETEPLFTEETLPVEEPVPVSGTAIGAVLAFLLLVLLAAVISKKKEKMTLRTYMTHFPQGMDVHEAVAMLMGAAFQLRDLHNNGKLHLQISPDTILISAKGSILKAPSKKEIDRHCSGFTAPEVYKGAGYGVTSDLYSFTAALLFAVTGSMPVNSLQQSALLEEIAALEEAEPAFGAVIRNALAFLPQDRTQSMQDLIYGISAYNIRSFRIAQPANTKKANHQAQDAAQRETHTARKTAEKAAREAAAAEEAEKIAAEKATREAAAAERIAAKKAAQEAAAAQKAEKIAAEKAAAAERAEKKAAEKAAKEAAAAEKAKKRAAEKAARKAAVAERAEKKAAEKTARKAAAAEKAEKIAAEKAARKAAAAAKQKEETAATSKNQNPVNIRKAVVVTICTAAVFVPLLNYVIIPAAKYHKALSLMDAGQYEDAITAFKAMDGYRDSVQQIDLCREGIRETTYREAVALKEQKAYPEAIAVFEELGDYKDSKSQISACLDSLDESAYLAAVELMKNGDFLDAKQQLEAVVHYKDSEALLQTCEQELLRIRKENAVTMMAAGHYEYAMSAFRKLEEDGIDCSAEIAECEPGLLELNTQPYVTHGKPKGYERNVPHRTEGKVKVHSMTRVDLDNECVRFTIDCTPSASTYVSYFDPPDGNLFMYVDRTGLQPVRQTLVFDVLKKDIKAAKELTIKFGTVGDWIFVRNPY